MTIDQNAQRIFGAKRRAEPEHEGEPVSAALRSVDAAPSDVVEPNTVEQGKPDPSPTVPAIAQDRAHQLVANITSHMLGELRGLRDEIDNLIRDATERRDLLFDAIRAHAEFTDAAIAHKVIITESMTRMRADFDKSRTPLPPARKI